jgi:hypothetical protein
VHASASVMCHHVDEPQAGKNQQDHESQGNRIHDHAMPIVIGAFRAFVFPKVWDWPVVWRGMTDRDLPTMTSMGGTNSRPETYDTAVSVVKAPGSHGGICPYLSGASAASDPEVRNRACRTICANFGSAALDLHYTLIPLPM